MTIKLRHRYAAAIGISLVAALAATAVPALAHSDIDSMITVQGGGWGHGIGMSQYGAYGRAVDGQTHEEILEFYYPGAELTTAETPDDVAIHIHSGSGTVVKPTGDVQIIDADGEVIYNHRNEVRLTIDKIPGGFTIIKPSGKNVCIDPELGDECVGDQISIRFIQGEPIRVDVIDKVSIGTSGNSYQWGELVISERDFAPNSTLWVVLEQLTMDQYIYGLAEVPASWPSAALQTQAVAGRTYGFDRMTARRASSSWNYPWDLHSTVNDQVYHGLSKEIGEFGPIWTAAVDATSGQVMLYNGDPITAFYSSSNGGHSEDSGYVFVTSLPYLVPQPDPFDSFGNPYATWSRDYTGTEVGQWLSTSGLAQVGAVTDVAISGNIGASGRVDRATVTVFGVNGNGQMSGNSFRNSINSGVASQGGGLSRQILSTKYKVTVLGGEDPIGAVDDTDRSGNSVWVSGWVFDPDSAATVNVEIRVDGEVVAEIPANQSRFDIDAAFGEGSSRGYAATVDVGGGAHQLCVYADNLGPGEHMLLGCVVV